mmetsp:Transcript_3565/g.11099  ORF Transcript_3565/g.11099 Transcript_3565/m.11099 type:complete len:272 (+) Transcript_3565:207-1022(+)
MHGGLAQLLTSRPCGGASTGSMALNACAHARLPRVAWALSRCHTKAAPHRRGDLDDADWLRHGFNDSWMYWSGRRGRRCPRAWDAVVALGLHSDAVVALRRLASSSAEGHFHGQCPLLRPHCLLPGCPAQEPWAGTVRGKRGGRHRATAPLVQARGLHAGVPAGCDQAFHLRPGLLELREQGVALRRELAVLRLAAGEALAQLRVLGLHLAEALLREVPVPLRLAQELQHHVRVPGRQDHGLGLPERLALGRRAALAERPGVRLARGGRGR